MRRVITTTTAALAAAAILGGAAGAAQAARSDTFQLDLATAPLAGAPGTCQLLVTMTAGTPDAVRDYVYEIGTSPITPGPKHNPLPGGVTTTSSQMVFTVAAGSAFDFAAYAEYSSGRHTSVGTLIQPTVAC
jgi:hypothetical protein